MPALDRAAILAAQDQQLATVPVPEWGEGAFVHVRSLTGTERDAYEMAVYKNDANVRATLCRFGICNQEGERIFGAADVAPLGKKSAAALDRCYDKIRELSGMNRAAQEAIEKNSKSPAGEDSSSASPDTSAGAASPTA